MTSPRGRFALTFTIALAALASVPVAAPAAPLGPSFMPAVADSATVKPTLVAMGEGRDKSNPAYQVWRRNGGVYGGRGRNFDGRGRDYYRGRHYGGGDNYYVRDRRHWRRHYRDNYYRPRSGVFFGLGLGSGYYDPYDSYYGDPYYSEPIYRPRVIQRRAYRAGSAHVQWCYNRYRSYRAWDNTFQPYNGPRQQCWSPYS